jgi:hypothetical protein
MTRRVVHRACSPVECAMFYCECITAIWFGVAAVVATACSIVTHLGGAVLLLLTRLTSMDSKLLTVVRQICFIIESGNGKDCSYYEATPNELHDQGGAHRHCACWCEGSACAQRRVPLRLLGGKQLHSIHVCDLLSFESTHTPTRPPAHPHARTHAHPPTRTHVRPTTSPHARTRARTHARARVDARMRAPCRRAGGRAGRPGGGPHAEKQAGRKTLACYLRGLDLFVAPQLSHTCARHADLAAET